VGRGIAILAVHDVFLPSVRTDPSDCLAVGARAQQQRNHGRVTREAGKVKRGARILSPPAAN